MKFRNPDTHETNNISLFKNLFPASENDVFHMKSTNCQEYNPRYFHSPYCNDCMSCVSHTENNSTPGVYSNPSNFNSQEPAKRNIYGFNPDSCTTKPIKSILKNTTGRQDNENNPQPYQVTFETFENPLGVNNSGTIADSLNRCPLTQTRPEWYQSVSNLVPAIQNLQANSENKNSFTPQYLNINAHCMSEEKQPINYFNDPNHHLYYTNYNFAPRPNQTDLNEVHNNFRKYDHSTGCSHTPSKTNLLHGEAFNLSRFNQNTIPQGPSCNFNSNISYHTPSRMNLGQENGPNTNTGTYNYQNHIMQDTNNNTNTYFPSMLNYSSNQQNGGHNMSNGNRNVNDLFSAQRDDKFNYPQQRGTLYFGGKDAAGHPLPSFRSQPCYAIPADVAYFHADKFEVRSMFYVLAY